MLRVLLHSGRAWARAVAVATARGIGEIYIERERDLDEDDKQILYMFRVMLVGTADEGRFSLICLEREEEACLPSMPGVGRLRGMSE